MRRIVTAITAASLALSMVALTVPAAAATGFDSAYAGESAFLTLSPGQTGTFTVFFANTGTTSWVKGTATQVDLAACLDDKVTCNAQDANDAAFNDGWLSATRYTTQTQTTVAPGTIGTFTYNVMVPAGQASGIHDFNGALVVSATGADVHNEGYYQDVNVQAPSAAAATLVALTPLSGTTAGGTSVTITGTGFVCTPGFPTVTFDTSAATVTSCGSTTLTATSPAHAAGTINVTVTNAGAPASNALLYTYAAPAPSFTSVTAYAGPDATTGGSLFVMSFDQPVCVVGGPGALVGNVTLTHNGISDVGEPDAFSGKTCTGGAGNASTKSSSAIWGHTTAVLVPGDFVAVTINATAAGIIQNAAGKAMSDAQTETTTVVSPSAAPSMSSAQADGGSTPSAVDITYTAAVTCSNTAGAAAQFTAQTASTAVTGTAITCDRTTFGSTVITVTFGTTDVTAGGSIGYVQSGTKTDRVQSALGVYATSPQTIAFAVPTPPAPPTITATAITNNGTTTRFGDSADAFTLTFSAEMTHTTAITIQVIDSDPGTQKTVATFDCTMANNSTCSWNSGYTVLTVTANTLGPTVNVAGTNSGCVLPTNVGNCANAMFLPVTIIGTTGLTDKSTNSAVNLAGSVKTIQ